MPAQLVNQVPAFPAIRKSPPSDAHCYWVEWLQFRCLQAFESNRLDLTDENFSWFFAHTRCMASYEKIYVAVYLKIDMDGFMKPVAIEWTDGTLFEIEKIIDERNAPPEYTGGVLTRKYKVIIKGREKLLYLDRQTNQWFVERLAG